MLTDEQIKLVRESFALVHKTRPEIVEIFYTRLFVTEPTLRDKFPQDISGQAGKLEATIQLALSALEDAESLIPALKNLGQRHADLGVTEGQYHIVNEVLLDTLAAEAGDLWTLEVSQAWSTILVFVSETMIKGARDAAKGAA